MKLILETEDRIRLEVGAGALEIEAEGGVHFSPFHMLAASLATCTVSVLVAWAEQAKLDISGLAIGVAWEFAEAPYRVGRIEQAIDWPELPEGRCAAAVRAADACTIHHTLQHPPDMSTLVR